MLDGALQHDDRDEAAFLHEDNRSADLFLRMRRPCLLAQLRTSRYPPEFENPYIRKSSEVANIFRSPREIASDKNSAGYRDMRKCQTSCAAAYGVQ